VQVEEAGGTVEAVLNLVRLAPQANVFFARVGLVYLFCAPGRGSAPEAAGPN
jgi:hypothetical protein